ncbi:FtsH protease activity modulator HflK [Porticoccus litoralis]|jgi:membrane protease subunit HflK|uniref:Protein HflK n=1 Tax=Porticoccus litoralis TaxID=434086 RepID=A0AAW8B3T5_9GAMM|nr:FtsH protease activity modulator HflK [Porticoccus litoralis]MDP1520404.1 FtsH protease activity modulator HflK [Porticoccus litoralis]
MAWNEPGGGKDPWGGNSGGDGPPDLDEALQKLRARMDKIFGGSGGGKGGSGNNNLLAIVLVVLVAGWGLFGFYQVDEKEQAVVLRLGKYLDTVGPGLNWRPLLLDRVFKERVTEERQYSSRGQMLTQDENIVELPLTVQYNINNVKDFVLNVKNPELSLRHATDSALRHVVGSSSLDEVVSTGRGKIAEEVKLRLQQYLDSYGAGILVRKINIQEAKPPSEVKAAYDDVIKAREDQERLINEAQSYSNGIIPEARGKAQRMLEEALAYKEQVVAEAQGETNRFLALLTEYQKAPEVTRQRLYLDAVQDVMSNSSKVLIDVEGGNNMLYLPLDKIIESSASGSSAASGLKGSDVKSIADEVVNRLKRETITSSSRREVR